MPSIMTFTEPEILVDRTRLPEIYHLRVFAWENSPSPASIDRKNYPNGFFDSLDKNAVHWVSYDDSGRIIAAARLAIIQNIEDLPYPRIFDHFELPPDRPFLLYSRLVIHPDYRKSGLKEKFDSVRMRFQIDNGYPFSIATAGPVRAKELPRYGWRELGDVSELDDSRFPFGKERSLLLLLLLHEIKLPQSQPDEDLSGAYTCGFQMGNVMQLAEETE